MSRTEGGTYNFEGSHVVHGQTRLWGLERSVHVNTLLKLGETIFKTLLRIINHRFTIDCEGIVLLD